MLAVINGLDKLDVYGASCDLLMLCFDITQLSNFNVIIDSLNFELKN